MGAFSELDYLVFFGTIGISFTIGLVFAIRQRNRADPEDYFLAGRKIGILPAALSFVVTFQSSLMVLGGPVEVYLYGTVFCCNIIGIVLSYTFAGITIVPVFHSLLLTSVYKYFEIRYQNNVVRYMVMSGAVIYNVFYMATVTYGTCVALEVVMGIPFWATVLIYTTVTAVYTSIGGIKGVIWTDVFQLLIMVTGVLAVHIKASFSIGGPRKVFEIAASRLTMDFGFDVSTRYSFWNIAAGSFSIYAYFTYAQAGIQRINSTPTVRSGRWLYFISGPIFSVVWLLTTLQGVSVFAYHSTKGCDMIASGQIENVNGLMPVTILKLFQNIPGMAGLFIASLSSAVLSTLSSCLNSLSAITYEDILKVKFPDISEQRATLISKIVVLMYGIIGIALTFVVSQIPGSVAIIFIAMMGCMEGPTVAIFVLSTMFRRSTTKGMVVGGLTGAAITLWISLGRLLSDVPPDPTLPPGPVDHCSADNYSSIHPVDIFNKTYTLETTTYAARNNFYITNTNNNSIGTDHQKHLSPLQEFYSISRITYSFVGLMTTLIVGIIVSLITKPPDVIDERCLFSFTKHVLGKKDNRHTDRDGGEELEPFDTNKRR